MVPRFKDLEQGNSIIIYAPRLERDTEKARRWDEAAGMSKQNWDMSTALALDDRDPRPPPTTFLETQLCLGTYAALQDVLLGEYSPFTNQVLALRKTMDLPKVFGTRDQWDDHWCRQLVWAVYDKDVSYCGIRLTPDDFCQPKEKIPYPMTTLALAIGELAGARRWTAVASQKSGNGTTTASIRIDIIVHLNLK